MFFLVYKFCNRLLVGCVVILFSYCTYSMRVHWTESVCNEDFKLNLDVIKRWEISLTGQLAIIDLYLRKHSIYIKKDCINTYIKDRLVVLLCIELLLVLWSLWWFLCS